MSIIPEYTRRFYDDKNGLGSEHGAIGTPNWPQPFNSKPDHEAPTPHKPVPLIAVDSETRDEPNPSKNDEPNGDAAKASCERSLPLQGVTDVTLDDTYTEFIMYCNPQIPADTDATELKKAFRAVPKSDGKTFNTYSLFEQIRRFENKELKTWAQVATELGVELPALDRGQSAQKVQQYAVRLKRWMHAMHIDAFFEYLLGKQHVYWTQIPRSSTPAADRDGVAAEEDLALRALLPETRPKRGRRKAEDRDNDSETGRSPSQRPRIYYPTLSDDFSVARSRPLDSSIPHTAHPGGLQSSDGRLPPWGADEARASSVAKLSAPNSVPAQSEQPARWQSYGSNQAPILTHPQSAILPRTANPFLADEEEPQSAITPSKNRFRRKHGPAVSSAWPSGRVTAGGKLRGRPPSNCTVTEGPFSTFPANPAIGHPPASGGRDDTPTSATIVSNRELQSFNLPPPPNISAGRLSARPNGLQLKVPERIGGQVRLATPPSMGLIDSERSLTGIPPTQQTLPPAASMDTNGMDTNGNLRGNEIHPVQWRASPSTRSESEDDRTNVDVVESVFIQQILAAEWVDSKGAAIEHCSLEDADRIVKKIIETMRGESQSPEAFIISISAPLGGRMLLAHLKIVRLEETDKSIFEATWTTRFGAIKGSFTIRTSLERETPTNADRSVPRMEEDGEAAARADVEDGSKWRMKYIELQNEVTKREIKVRGLKRTILDALLGTEKMDR